MFSTESMYFARAFSFGIIIIASLLQSVLGHGYLMQPPQRSSAWRYGFPTLQNFDDNTLFCGGFGVSFFYSLVFLTVSLFSNLDTLFHTHDTVFHFLWCSMFL